MSDAAKGIAKLQEEMKRPHVVTRRIKYRSRLPDQRYIDPSTGELVTFEHMLERWRDYKFLRDGRHIRLATAEEIAAWEADQKNASPAKSAASGDKSTKGGKS